MGGKAQTVARTLRAGSWRALETLKDAGQVTRHLAHQDSPPRHLQTLSACRLTILCQQQKYHPTGPTCRVWQVRHLGVSNYLPVHLLDLLATCRHPPDVCQSEHHRAPAATTAPPGTRHTRRSAPASAPHSSLLGTSFSGAAHGARVHMHHVSHVM
jgi:diketogulonate reductase-like aldo/keto reductase